MCGLKILCYFLIHFCHSLRQSALRKFPHFVENRKALERGNNFLRLISVIAANLNKFGKFPCLACAFWHRLSVRSGRMATGGVSMTSRFSRLFCLFDDTKAAQWHWKKLLWIWRNPTATWNNTLYVAFAFLFGISFLPVAIIVLLFAWVYLINNLNNSQQASAWAADKYTNLEQIYVQHDFATFLNSQLLLLLSNLIKLSC